MLVDTPTKYPDPREADFTYLQPTFAQDDTAGQLKALEEDGFALIPTVLSREQVDEAKAEIDRLRAFGFDSNNVGWARTSSVCSTGIRTGCSSWITRG